MFGCARSRVRHGSGRRAWRCDGLRNDGRWRRRRGGSAWQRRRRRSLGMRVGRWCGWRRSRTRWHRRRRRGTRRRARSRGPADNHVANPRSASLAELRIIGYLFAAIRAEHRPTIPYWNNTLTADCVAARSAASHVTIAPRKLPRLHGHSIGIRQTPVKEYRRGGRSGVHEVSPRVWQAFDRVLEEGQS